MMFKLDWTQLDHYNFRDLNRVESNIEAISIILESMAYIPEIHEIKKNWDRKDFPTLTQMNRIESNIEALRQSFYTPVGWEDRKVWAKRIKFSWEDALRFERNLSLLQQLINLVKDSLKYSGTFSAGEEVIL